MVETPVKTATLEEAFAYCERLARAHYENFTVVSWFLPERLRPSMFSVYAFCRHTDDLGDEAPSPGSSSREAWQGDGRVGEARTPHTQPQGEAPKGDRVPLRNYDRLALLDRWEEDLRRCYGARPEHPILVALQQAIGKHGMPVEPFLRLIEANRMDQRNRCYPTYGDLLHYCDHSANPVGHMVLQVFGYADPERQRLADATCTALQLANFWQDVKRDLALGRIYIPLEDMERFGYSERELEHGVCNDSFRRLMAFEVERARALFHQGAELANRVDGELRLDLTLFTLGGLAVLDAIERQGYDVLSRRPVVSKARKIRLMLGALAKLTARRAFRGRSGG